MRTKATTPEAPSILRHTLRTTRSLPVISMVFEHWLKLHDLAAQAAITPRTICVSIMCRGLKGPTFFGRGEVDQLSKYLCYVLILYFVFVGCWSRHFQFADVGICNIYPQHRSERRQGIIVMLRWECGVPRRGTLRHSNNETGALQPIKEIVQRVRLVLGCRSCGLSNNS